MLFLFLKVKSCYSWHKISQFFEKGKYGAWTQKEKSYWQKNSSTRKCFIFCPTFFNKLFFTSWMGTWRFTSVSYQLKKNYITLVCSNSCNSFVESLRLSPQVFVIAKREAYSLDKLHLRLLSVYLACQKRLFKVVLTCSSLSNSGVPQGHLKLFIIFYNFLDFVWSVFAMCLILFNLL